MAWIRRVVVVVLVARDTGCVGGGQIVVIVLVAVGAGAGRHGVAAHQREAGQRVIEISARPAVGVVTILAGRGRKEVGRGMYRIGRAFEVFLVAADAIGGHGRELAESGILVAVLAGCRCVRSSQREAVLVLVDLGGGNIPSSDRVAVLAGPGHLAAVDVSVAVRTPGADIAEDHLRVAVHAIDTFVHATERKLRLGIVVEFRDGANRLPAVNGVAVLARDIQVAVRAASIIVRYGQRGGKNHSQ